MLYKVDYVQRSDGERHTRWINHAESEVAAMKRFMDWFFFQYPDDAVKPRKITAVEFIGDLSQIELIDEAVK